MLLAAKIPLTLIDIKPAQIDVHQQYGAKVFYGDGTRADLLRRAGAHEADAIVFCMDDKEFGAERVREIIQSFPETKIFVRVYDRRQLIALKGLGIVGMKRELFESAVHLAQADDASRSIWTSSLIDEVDEEFRQRDCDRLEAQLKSGGEHARRCRTQIRIGHTRPRKSDLRCAAGLVSSDSSKNAATSCQFNVVGYRYVWPMPLASRKGRVPPLIFLSCIMWSTSRCPGARTDAVSRL